ncbi:MAG: N-acetylmuramoyl-L-alanine amidase [Pseudomonadota bacterium]
MVVIHYTAMADAAAAIERLCDPLAEVSAHYVIARDGSVTALVAEDRRAWHAGVASWAGETDVNSRSIGIELDNPGLDGDTPVPFAAAQMAALERLLAAILARHAIPPARVVGHACVAPGRKADPGPAFDWRRLARSGLAVWLDPGAAARGVGPAAPAARFRGAALGLGLGLEATGPWDASAGAAWSALAARFLPAHWRSARPSEGATAHLERLATAYPAVR